MEFVEDCKKHSDICSVGFLIGVIITLIIVWIYLFRKDHFIDPSLDATTAAILAYKNSTDPSDNQAMKKMYNENLENKKENSALVGLLYR
jgi:hypothetical protein